MPFSFLVSQSSIAHAVHIIFVILYVAHLRFYAIIYKIECRNGDHKELFYMNLVEHKCANCGANLHKISATEFGCEYCGSVYMLKKSGTLKKKKAKSQADVAVKPKETGSKAIKPQATKTKVTSRTRTQSKNATWEKGSIQEAFWAIVALLWFGAMLILGGTGLIALIMHLTGEKPISQNTNNKQEIVIEQKNYGVSDEFRQVAEAVFEKPYGEISEGEFDSVSKVYITYSGGSGLSEGYFIVDGRQKDFSCEVSFIQVMYDFKNLRNLSALSTNCPILEGTLDELNSLTEIETDCTVAELLESVPNPEQITVLRGVEMKDGAEGLQEFCNLKVLDIEIDGVKNIAALGELKNLEEIRIDSDDGLKGFDVLSKLTKLKKVSLYSFDLYSISFAKDLPKLESLVIESDCPLENIDALTGKNNLKELHILNCNDIEDFSVINTLTGLEELSVNGYNLAGVVDWSKLSELTKLSVMSVNSQELLDELSQIEQLESLSLLYSRSRGVEKIFALPNLKDLSFLDCDLEINFDEMTQNNSLEKLSIRYCDFFENYQEVSDGYYTYAGYDSVELSEHIDFVKNFQGLRELTIRGAKLSNLDFVMDLTNLTMLDVTNNCVENVRGVNECESLVELWLGDNVITTAPVFNHEVTVHMDEESNWRYD